MRRIKKSGFTLAEVLITLAIIGVVATLTLPALMSNTQEQQSVTGFRKAMNTLNEVAQMNAAVDGFDYSNITVGTISGTTSGLYTNGSLEQSVWGMMVTKAQVNISQSGNGKIVGGGCGAAATAFVGGMAYADGDAASTVNATNHILFRDGTALCYEAATTSSADGLIKGYVDTNGRKGPNAISTCGDEDCITSKNIKDQFAVTLRGGTAVPGHMSVSDGAVTEGTQAADKAARWAMSK